MQPIDFDSLTKTVLSQVDLEKNDSDFSDSDFIESVGDRALDLAVGKPGIVLDTLVVWHSIAQGLCEELYADLTESEGLSREDANDTPELRTLNLVRRGLRKAYIEKQKPFIKKDPTKTHKSKENRRLHRLQNPRYVNSIVDDWLI